MNLKSGKDENPNFITFLFDIIDDFYIEQYIDNTFIIFNSSKTNILYLIYSTKNQTIKSYNLNSFSVIAQIKNAHKENIINFRHHFIKNEKRDLVMSLSYDNNIKIWDIIKMECLINLKNINDNGGILSGCFLIENNNKYIITSNLYNFEPIKIFNFDGIKLKEINNSKENTFFVDIYYDINKLKYA